jgi:hypothetical protein
VSSDRLTAVERTAARAAVGVLIAAIASTAGLVAVGDRHGAGSVTLAGSALGGTLALTSFAAFVMQVR